MQSWLPNPAAHMCFRIAVRAVEAWLLADRERIAQLLKITIAHVPQNPDELNDPKQQLINLARGSRLHTIRSDLAPREGSGRPVGPLYTARMIQFVNDETGGWRPGHALHYRKAMYQTSAGESQVVESEIAGSSYATRDRRQDESLDAASACIWAEGNRHHHFLEKESF